MINFKSFSEAQAKLPASQQYLQNLMIAQSQLKSLQFDLKQVKQLLLWLPSTTVSHYCTNYCKTYMLTVIENCKLTISRLTKIKPNSRRLETSQVNGSKHIWCRYARAAGALASCTTVVEGNHDSSCLTPFRSHCGDFRWPRAIIKC